jgi:flavin reductase (DIM6/NTAB) family NADH-FMN oxidoreductase RutF
MKKVTTHIKSFQYFYPYTVAVVGAKSENRLNYMSAAWHTALSFNPPLFGVLLSKKRLTHEVISEAREFTVNFLDYDRVKLSAQMGRISGHDRDKVAEFQVKLEPAKFLRSPILAEAYAAFECKLTDVRAFGDHDLFVGAVIAVHTEDKSFRSDGVLDTRKVQPLLYLGSDFYVTIDPDTLKHVLPD